MQRTHVVKLLRVFLGPFRHLCCTSKPSVHSNTVAREKRQEHIVGEEFYLHGRGMLSFGSLGKSVV